MSIKRGMVVVCVVVAFMGGYLAQGQNREKPADPAKADPVKKGTAAAAAAQPAAPKADTAKKSADAPKKPAESGKPGTAKPAEDPEEKVIRASAEAFTKLYNAHDAKGLAALFSPKAEMIDEDDNVVKGREEIQKAFDEVFKQNPQASMDVDVESVRVLTPMLAIEEGTARSKDSPDDPEDVTVYVAVHVKLDGKWQLACVRDWDAPSEALSPHDHLERDLSWLVGEWIDESPDSVVHSVCKWHDNGNFLMKEFTVQIEGQIAMSGTLRIGWDAVHNQFKCWVFDSNGGHSQGLWLRDGEDWIVKLDGSTAAGETASSTNLYRRLDNDSYAWQSIDRVVDGERQDDIEPIVVTRKPPLPAE